MKKLIIKNFVFLSVINKKDSVSDWVLIPNLMRREIKEVLSGN
ncbi:MAG: hypothetical protein ABIK81_01710 [candidate division WOR-3 bacterium]